MSDIRNHGRSGWYIDSIGTTEEPGWGGEAIVRHRLNPDTVTARIYGVSPEHAEATALRMIDSATAKALRDENDELRRQAADAGNLAVAAKAARRLLDSIAEIDGSLEYSSEYVEALELALADVGLPAPSVPATERGDFPERCPVTGLPFFLVLGHPTRGHVPTYGGPLDSYTIPERDATGEWHRERYDHDAGRWVEWETVPDGQVLAEIRQIRERVEQIADETKVR